MVYIFAMEFKNVFCLLGFKKRTANKSTSQSVRGKRQKRRDSIHEPEISNYEYDDIHKHQNEPVLRGKIG